MRDRQAQRSERREPENITDDEELGHEKREMGERDPNSGPWMRRGELRVQIGDVDEKQQTEKKGHPRIALETNASQEKDGKAQENELVDLQNAHERDERLPLTRCLAQAAAHRVAARQHADDAQEIKRISLVKRANESLKHGKAPLK